jgi:hypothetical protein
MISEVSVEVGLEKTRELIVPLLADLSVDPEPAVRQRMIEQLSPLSKASHFFSASMNYTFILF